jgi:hypothetical protein
VFSVPICCISVEAKFINKKDMDIYGEVEQERSRFVFDYDNFDSAWFGCFSVFDIWVY